MRFSLTALLLVLILAACERKQQQSNLTVSGELPAMASKTLFIDELNIRSKSTLDSLQPDQNGDFTFKLNIDEAGFFVLYTSEENQMILQADPGDRIVVTSGESNFSEGYSVTGSEGSALLQKFEAEIQHRKNEIDSLSAVYYEARGSEGFLELKEELDTAYAEIIKQYRKFVKDQINRYPGSLASLIILNRRLGTSRVIDEEDDYYLFHKADSALSERYPGNSHVVDHHERTKEIRLRIFDKAIAEEKVLPGRKAPDIVMNDTAGNPFSLKSYLGNPVLIQFWAGWNARARKDNQRLIARYDELSKKGFKLLGVSLDEKSVVWKGAVNLDSLPWKQVSDLGGLNSEIAKIYNLPERLPYYYLLDKNHTILFKNKNLDSLLMEVDRLNLKGINSN